MNNLKLFSKKGKNEQVSAKTTFSVNKLILDDLKTTGLVFTDSDMFKYCDFYTGNFWQQEEKRAA